MKKKPNVWTLTQAPRVLGEPRSEASESKVSVESGLEPGCVFREEARSKANRSQSQRTFTRALRSRPAPWTGNLRFRLTPSSRAGLAHEEVHELPVGPHTRAASPPRGHLRGVLGAFGRPWGILACRRGPSGRPRVSSSSPAATSSREPILPGGLSLPLPTPLGRPFWQDRRRQTHPTTGGWLAPTMGG